MEHFMLQRLFRSIRCKEETQRVLNCFFNAVHAVYFYPYTPFANYVYSNPYFLSMNPTLETSALPKEKWTELICDFIRQIGLEIREAKPGATATFLPGVEIENGVLLYNPEKLLYPGDLLHEAGHMALTPANQRTKLSGNVINTDPQREGDEIAVMLWTYAAAMEGNIPLELVFHEHGYKGQSDWLIENYQKGTYIGLPLLKWMGLTDDAFPKMKRWLRE